MGVTSSDAEGYALSANAAGVNGRRRGPPGMGRVTPMTIFLGDQFIRAVQSSPLKYEYAGRNLTIEANGRDRLRVRDGDVILAHVTGYSESESGILPAGYTLDVLAPIFRTLDDALNSLRIPPRD